MQNNISEQIEIPQPEIEQTWNYPSIASEGNSLPRMPNDETMRNKFISTGNAMSKISIKNPIIKEEKIVIPLLDKEGKMVTVEGMPVIKKIKTMRYIDGFENVDIEFPVKSWFNDSVPSSFLTDAEVYFLRDVDVLAYSLYIETLKKKKIDHTETLGLLAWMKGSISDTAKGRSGVAVEKAITTVSKSEAQNYNYQKEAQIREEEIRKKAGLLGLGWWIF